MRYYTGKRANDCVSTLRTNQTLHNCVENSQKFSLCMQRAVRIHICILEVGSGVEFGPLCLIVVIQQLGSSSPLSQYRCWCESYEDVQGLL